MGLMRRLVVPPTCLVLLLMLFMAPYQHVHLAMDHDPDAGDHHHDDDAAVVHVHFYESVAPTQNGQPAVDDPDRDHVSRSLDSFATMPAVDMPVLYRPESRIFIFPPEQRVVAIVESIEPCGHDPPLLARSVPRGPPA